MTLNQRVGHNLRHTIANSEKAIWLSVDAPGDDARNQLSRCRENSFSVIYFSRDCAPYFSNTESREIMSSNFCGSLDSPQAPAELDSRAERGVERQFGVETQQALRRDQRADGVFAFAFAEEAFEQVATDGAPSAGLHSDRGTFESRDRNAEQWFRAEKPANDDNAGDGGENHRTEDAGAPAANDFFDDEEDGGNGRVKSSGESGSSTDGSHQTQFLA